MTVNGITSKKLKIILFFILISLIVCIVLFNIPKGLNKQVINITNDFYKNEELFNRIIENMNKDEPLKIEADNYDGTDNDLNFLFENLKYDCVVSYGDIRKGIYFEKYNDGFYFTGIVFATHTEYIQTPKSKICKELKKNWYIVHENYL